MPEPILGDRRQQHLHLGLGVGVDAAVPDRDRVDMLGDVSLHEALALRVGQDHRDGLGELVHRDRAPRPTGPTLSGPGATGEQIGHQLIDMSLGQPLHRFVAVAFDQRL